MPNQTNLDTGLELIQSTASARYESSTLRYIISIVKDLPDDEWEKIIDHLIYCYIKTKGDLPTPSQFVQARREVRAARPTKMNYRKDEPQEYAPGQFSVYYKLDKGQGRPLSDYSLVKVGAVKTEEGGTG